jgi:hypothetical protein
MHHSEIYADSLLNTELLYDLITSPNIIRVIKIKKNEMGWPSGTYGERGAA